MGKNMKILLKALKKIRRKDTMAMPERPRKLATKILDSNEIYHLTKHIIKIILWPDSQDYNKWVSEIKISLFNNLSFGLCRFCIESEPRKRCITKLWFGARDIQKRINEYMVDAYWDVRESIDKDPKVSNPFTKEDRLRFEDLGYVVKEEKDPVYGIRFGLWYKGKKIC